MINIGSKLLSQVYCLMQQLRQYMKLLGNIPEQFNGPLYWWRSIGCPRCNYALDFYRSNDMGLLGLFVRILLRRKPAYIASRPMPNGCGVLTYDFWEVERIFEPLAVLTLRTQNAHKRQVTASGDWRSSENTVFYVCDKDNGSGIEWAQLRLLEQKPHACKWCRWKWRCEAVWQRYLCDVDIDIENCPKHSVHPDGCIGAKGRSWLRGP